MAAGSVLHACSTRSPRMEAPTLFRVIMDAAMAGDMMAARIVADRIWPQRKGRPVRLNFPAGLDPFASLGVTIKGMAEGVISPEEAAAVATTLVAQARLAEGRRDEPRDAGKRVVIYLPSNRREKVAANSREPALPEGVAEAIAASVAELEAPATLEPHQEAPAALLGAALERLEPDPLPEEPKPAQGPPTASLEPSPEAPLAPPPMSSVAKPGPRADLSRWQALAS